MINTVYKLVAPRRFEIKYSDIDLNNNKVIVRPTYLSICNADQRYYQGLRDAEILRKKLPMALIHEAIGEVVRDPSGNFKTGELVVMVPSTPVEKDDIIAENYLRTSKFRASGFDGFMQEYVEITPDRLVRLPQDIDRTVAAFTEIVSVSVHAIGRFDKIAHKRRNVVGIRVNSKNIQLSFREHSLKKHCCYISKVSVTPDSNNISSLMQEYVEITPDRLV